MIIVFYNKRARVSAFPLTVVREKIPFSKEGNETRHLGFYNATLNALLEEFLRRRYR